MPIEHAVYINGEPHLRMDPRREPIENKDDARSVFVADATAAMLKAHDANTDTPMDPAIAAAAADWCWWRFISLRPTQLDALIAIQVEEDRCDASMLSMITGASVSQVNASKRKATTARDAARELAEQAAAVPVAAPAAPAPAPAAPDPESAQPAAEAQFTTQRAPQPAEQAGVVDIAPQQPVVHVEAVSIGGAPLPDVEGH